MARGIVVAVLGVSAALVMATGFRPSREPARAVMNGEMARAARALLDSMSGALREKVSLGFEDAARRDWHFVPRSRPGVTLGELTDSQRGLVQDLLRSALSSQGMLKANAIIDLELLLREMENGNTGRDPGKYTVTIYGEPGAGGGGAAGKPWGWKIEGHHLSLNFTSSGEVVTSVTPAFMGSNPASAPSGVKAGQRVLGAEEDLGRALLGLLDEEQRRSAVIAENAPADIMLMPGREFDAAPAVGLSAERMTGAQREALWAIVEEFAGNLRRELAASELKRIRAAGVEKIWFAWAGGTTRGEGHYYRVRGPTFVIEYDNTQNNANHVHTVWHDLTRDFSSDPLKEHYEQEHAGGEHGHERGPG
ncbi:MAG: DUF3500 domain-containing protein [Phycisphaerales bacterium]